MLFKFLKRELRQYRIRRAHVLDCPSFPCVLMKGWAVWPTPIRSESVVYSFGVGDDVGWDLEMIKQFGVTVHAFDPTPASIDWISRQTLPPEFIFRDVGISNFDGTLDFYPPRRPGNTHFSQIRRSGTFNHRRSVPGRVQRLSTTMRMLDHQRIDVLKLDIEGSEFEAIPDLIASGVEVDQLLVEIHYQFPSKSFRLGLDLIRQLNAHGMRCFYVSPRGFEFSFVRNSLAEQWRSPQSQPQAA